MGRLYSQDSKPQGLIRSKCHFDFHRKNNFYKGVPSKTYYSIGASQSLKQRFFSSSENLNDRCEENEVLNS
jgi:hypothetical protein